jgi:hypothetical protein
LASEQTGFGIKAIAALVGPTRKDQGRDHNDTATQDDQTTVVAADDDPHRLASVVLDAFSADAEPPRLIHMHGQYYAYNGGCFRPEPDFPQVRLVQAVKAELDRSARAVNEHPTRVTRSLIADVNQALVSLTTIAREEEPPFWRERYPDDPDPLGALPAANGLVDLGSDPPAVLPHTSGFISTFALPYAYQPDAPKPVKWLKLLRYQWGDDPDTIMSINDIICYIFTYYT